MYPLLPWRTVVYPLLPWRMIFQPLHQTGIDHTSTKEPLEAFFLLREIPMERENTPLTGLVGAFQSLFARRKIPYLSQREKRDPVRSSHRKTLLSMASKRTSETIESVRKENTHGKPYPPSHEPCRGLPGHVWKAYTCSSCQGGGMQCSTPKEERHAMLDSKGEEACNARLQRRRGMRDGRGSSSLHRGEASFHAVAPTRAWLCFVYEL